MIKKSLVLAALLTFIAPSAFAYDGAIKFKGGCKVENTGSCSIAVSGLSGSVKLYASSAPNGTYGAVTHTFTAPGVKRIANSVNNVCFYARKVGATSRTREICLAK